MLPDGSKAVFLDICSSLYFKIIISRYICIQLNLLNCTSLAV